MTELQGWIIVGLLLVVSLAHAITSAALLRLVLLLVKPVITVGGTSRDWEERFASYPRPPMGGGVITLDGDS